jgi:hypothetical protein
MSEDSTFSECRGLNALGNPDTVTRTSDNGPSGTSPIGGRIWGEIIARGTPDGSLWRGRGGIEAGRESLRKSKSR